MKTPPNDHDHNHDHDHDEEGEEDGVVVLVDAEGNEVEFGILGFVEDEGQAYALMSPVEQLDDDESDDFDVYIFRYDELEDGSEEFAEVEDPVVFARVKARADQFFQEMESEEDEDGEDAEDDASDSSKQDDA